MPEYCIITAPRYIVGLEPATNFLPCYAKQICCLSLVDDEELPTTPSALNRTKKGQFAPRPDRLKSASETMYFAGRCTRIDSPTVFSSKCPLHDHAIRATLATVDADRYWRQSQVSSSMASLLYEASKLPRHVTTSTYFVDGETRYGCEVIRGLLRYFQLRRLYSDRLPINSIPRLDGGPKP